MKIMLSAAVGNAKHAKATEFIAYTNNLCRIQQMLAPKPPTECYNTHTLIQVLVQRAELL